MYVNVNVVEILAAVAFDWVNIVKSIEVVNTDDKRIIIKGKDIQWSHIPIYPSCQTIDLNDYMDFSKNVASYIDIYLNNITNLAAVVKLEDRRMSLSNRPVLSNEGFALQIEDLTSGKHYDYSLTIFEKINLEAGQGNEKGCLNYPTEKFLNYSECDMDFVYNEMKDKYKIMPFWAAKTLNEITNLT